MENVYVLFTSDYWLSSDSAECVGVFTSKDELEKGVKEAVKKSIKYFKNDDEELEETQNRIYEEFVGNRNQTQGYDLNLYAEEFEPNILAML